MTEPESVLEVQADLDIPGETGRQARALGIWGLCLGTAVIISAVVGRIEHGGTLEPDPAQIAISRARRLKVAGLCGLLLPALLTISLSRHHRRGGPLARGIVVDITSSGELRIWGRGYGTRVTLVGADVQERLVDVYAGRLGAWRQRRLVVRGGGGGRGGSRLIEVAAPAVAADLADGLKVEGGEGDCVELARADYDRLKARIVATIRAASSKS